VELLVSIAIIGMLVGILLPAFHRARQHAKLTVCIANMRNQGLSLVQYINQYDGRLPPKKVTFSGHGAPAGTVVPQPILFDRFLAQIDGLEFDLQPNTWPKPNSVWRCPEISRSDDYLRETHSGVIHYAPNTWLFNSVTIKLVDRETIVKGDAGKGWNKTLGSPTWRRIDRVARAERVVAIMDNVNYYHADHGHREARESVGRTCDVMSDVIAVCANNVGSHDALVQRPVLYADGHAAPLTLAPSYWLKGEGLYQSPDERPPVNLLRRDVELFFWYVDPKNEVPPD